MFKTHTQTDISFRNGNATGTETYTVRLFGIVIFRTRKNVVL
jgi:hypothetical protein